ncbi:hypothetical protein GCM10009627_14840 [Curtobacterium herbarum]|uniref:HTH araC/xylS-type domain-containing protein n=1 Tax=Curtobacterium herbarum TaxID=150122 RepID=A0ABP4K524_9MICO
MSRQCPCDVPGAALSATVGWTESFAACVRFFRANLADPELDVPMMASAMALSVRSVHALFADCGLQPAAEIRRTRLRVAEQLLTQTPLDVAEVRLLVGIRPERLRTYLPPSNGANALGFPQRRPVSARPSHRYRSRRPHGESHGEKKPRVVSGAPAIIRPTMGTKLSHDDAVEYLRQVDERKASQTNGDRPWTIVYDWQDSGNGTGARFAAFAAPSYRDRAMQSASWDMRVGGGFPGFSQSHRDGEWVTTYYRNSDGPELEPLVLVQQMHGIVPDAYHISEEFRLLMNLWEDKTTGNYYRITDDGSKELAIEFTDALIRIRTPILRRYQAARQLDLLLFSDSRVFINADEESEAFEELNEPDHVEKDSVVSLGVGNMDLGEKQVFSRLLVKRILPPPPQDQSGIWPWDLGDEEYPEFIIGEDQNGRPTKYTCEQDKLANYFGANPDAPHYLTPVFFKPEVLRRYYDDPNLYSISDGRLSCGYLWGVQIDNGNPDAVMVFLGDIGRDIPSSHRDHWRAYNIPPVSNMSESTFRRSFLAQFADTENPEHLFKNAYLAIQRAWVENWGWGLYREAKGSDAGLIQRVRIPLNDTDTEFEAQLLALAKLLVDMLDEAAISAGLPPVKDEKGISKLKRFLETHRYEHVERDIALLRRIQNLRSRIAAHTSGSSGQAFLAQELDGLSKPEFIEKLMRDATQMFADLSKLSNS